MTHAAIDALLVLSILLAYVVGKFRGFKDGERCYGPVISSRNREIDELCKTGKAKIEVSYRPIAATSKTLCLNCGERGHLECHPD